ncbi:MAG: HU family DNA-binding protein [Deltaproteobacteria bacterium]|jgi:DNA-binding protein HU-beta|nr:HU family DNA-binding protein [Deltaproteobacteria bacterium]
MAKSMTKSQVEDHIAKKTGVPKKTVREILAEMAELSYAEAKNAFTIPGVGKLVLVDRKARTGRNPRTGEPVEIPAKKVVKFRIAKACKEAILKNV